MKLLAISDHYISESLMRAGLEALTQRGVEIEIRPWEHPTLEELQEANLQIELHGPNIIEMPQRFFERLDQFDIIVVQFAPVGRAMIEAAKRLRWIGVFRGGIENIDKQAADARNISILNTPGRNARAVAECTVGLILAEIRNLARSHAELRRGNWTRDYPNGMNIPELNGKTVGLVGFGAIGRLVAHFLTAFGSKIIAFDPFVQGDTGNVEMVDLPTLLQNSDVVSVHARYSKETHHLIGKEQLALMKPSAILVNTARSGLVDEKALIECLRNRQIMGAALDVFDEEPIPPDHPFLTLDNVTITPHLAGSSIDAFIGSPKLWAERAIREGLTE